MVSELRFKALFISSSVGLGHITRDLYLSGMMKNVDVTWVTAGTALKYLESHREKLHPVSYDLASIGDLIAHLFHKGKLKMTIGDARRIFRAIKANSEIIRDHIDFEKYDCIISDEAWETLFLRDRFNVPSFFITDFLEFKSIGFSMLQRLGYWILNREVHKRLKVMYDHKFYVGFKELDYNPDFKWYGIIPTHKNLEYGFENPVEEDYILINIGGTDAGSYIKDVVSRLLSKHFNIVVIGGSKYFEPDPIKKIIGARLLITLAGYGSLLELIMYRKRGIIIPLGGHFEQIENAKLFMSRSGYRVIDVDDLSSVDLVGMIKELYEEDINPPVFKDGSHAILNDIYSVLTSH